MITFSFSGNQTIYVSDLTSIEVKVMSQVKSDGQS